MYKNNLEQNADSLDNQMGGANGSGNDDVMVLYIHLNYVTSVCALGDGRLVSARVGGALERCSQRMCRGLWTVGVHVVGQYGAGVERVERRLSARTGGAHGTCEQRMCPGQRAAGVCVVRQNGACVGYGKRCVSVRVGGAHGHGVERDRPGRRTASVRV